MKSKCNGRRRKIGWESSTCRILGRIQSQPCELTLYNQRINNRSTVSLLRYSLTLLHVRRPQSGVLISHLHIRCPVYPTVRSPSSVPVSPRGGPPLHCMRLPMLLARIALALGPILAPQPSQKRAIQHAHRGVARPSTRGRALL